jgi:flagellum-specific ATP synthase
MAGSGVGKSTLLGMIARYTEADVNVIALIGERGRELREFIEKDLQEQGLQKSVVVVATSDQPPLVRMRGAYIATTIAEYFQKQGKKVLLMMDSATRFAMAMREVGLAIGEPPTTKGYTPSVFAALPKLLERSGNFAEGSITGLYTVLVEGDDFNEPISDAMRSILDGHIVLSRELASRNIYPPIDVLASASRVMTDVTSPEHQRIAGKFKESLAVYRQSEDLINIGAYKTGSNPGIDYAISRNEGMQSYLKQSIHDPVSMIDSVQGLKAIFEG